MEKNLLKIKYREDSLVKNILVVFTGSMELGGIERSLLGLLDSIDYSKYNVDLFLYAHHGPLFNKINTNVNILPECKELAYLRESLYKKIKNRCFYSAYIRILDEIKKRFFHKEIVNDQSWKIILKKSVENITKDYDVVLNFFLPFDLSLEKVNAKKKVGWVHTDYVVEKNNLEELYRAYSQMDVIVAVSEEVKKSFITLFPNLKGKVVVIENILQTKYVLEQSELFSVSNEMDSNTIQLLSIGRFCYAKNFDNIPVLCKYLVEKGLSIKWYIIGYGADEQLIKDRIRNFGMQNHVFILGKKENPYPYIKACDIYIQPSRYEGKAVTVREAQVLHKPVVITNYPTSKSQVINGVDGIIVPMNNEKCAQAILEFINNQKLQDSIIKYLREHDYSNSNEVEKIYGLMED